MGLTDDKAKQKKEAGVSAFKEGNLDAAIMHFTESIALKSTDASVYSNRANVYISQFEFEKAVADADTAIKIDPNFARAYLRKATALFELTGLPDFLQQTLGATEGGIAVTTDTKMTNDFQTLAAKVREEMKVYE